MIKKTLAALLCLTLLTGCAGQGLPFSGDGRTISQLPEECRDSKDFATVLTRLLDTGEGNMAFSPLSAYIALAMAAEGAGGETLSQFESLLGAGIDDIGRAAAEIGKGLMETGGSTKLGLAQSVWTEETVEFSEEYISDLGQKYMADIYSGKLSSDSIRQAINHWAKDSTSGLIDPFLTDNLPDDTVIALINSLYFKGEWQTKFSPETFETDFTNLDGSVGRAGYMNVTGQFRYIDTGEATGVVLPYDDGKTNMIILMPKEQGLLPSSLACTLGSAVIAQMSQDAPLMQVNLTMPTFTTESSFSLVNALKAMGLTAAFDSQAADFSAMGGQSVHLSSVIQKVNITVDTKGTEAAAVTMVTANESAAVDLTYLKLDRPFFYAIMDQQTEMPLFMGTYNYAE